MEDYILCLKLLQNCCQFSMQTADFVLQVECNSKLDPTNTTFLKVDHHLALDLYHYLALAP